jgi:serine/threonine protein kinase
MNYELQELLGQGQFGEVWRSVCRKTNEVVAIKKEFPDSPCKMLKHETTVLHYLYLRGCRQIPLVYWFGIHEESPTLVMSYYECSLDQYAGKTNMSKELCNTFMIQMIRILKSIHEQSIIHRDIKPQNFMCKSNDQLCLIDFGLSSVFMDDKLQHHDPKPPIATILGTPKYISVNLHDGLDPSRRDDLISAGYIYIYLACGRHLPWENITYDRDQSALYEENHIMHYKNQERKHRKLWAQMETYCKIIGSEILEYMQNVYSLEYDELPKYNTLISNYKP